MEAMPSKGAEIDGNGVDRQKKRLESSNLIIAQTNNKLNANKQKHLKETSKYDD
jgi:hypothetical protein